MRILRNLAEGPKQQAELQRECGLPTQATLRLQLKRLTTLGAVTRHRHDPFPGALDYELTAGGEELLRVAEGLERWLAMAEDGPLALGDDAAKRVIKALAEGWSTTILRVLAARPLSLTELDAVIGSVSYPSLERRLTALRVARLIEPKSGNHRGTPYGVTEWLRYGMAPLLAAARWERRCSDSFAPLGRLDIETALLLVLPLLRLSPELSGVCRLGVESNGKSRLAGAMVMVDQGEVVSCTTNRQGRADAWALGSISAWLDAMLDRDVDSLEMGGNTGFVGSLLDGLHRKLVPIPARSY